MIYQYLYRITPYWLVHAIVAFLICWVSGEWYLGGLLYAVREFTQYEAKNDFDWSRFKSKSKNKENFDWKGFAAPVIVSLIILLI
ncbi:hypothetical protein [Reichenbachiella sp.]|uniref:hypothetical protein n=1 Tax=Reichenbachiella sp. TaxID=2184521 RepID=UPI003B5A402E